MKQIAFILFALTLTGITESVYSYPLKCNYSFTYHFSNDTLYMESNVEYDNLYDCGADFKNTPTHVDLGNGDTMRLVGSAKVNYIYRCNGNFHVMVTSSFRTVADFAVTITDIPACSPDFRYTLSYNTGSGIYSVTCVKTDQCSASLYYWNTSGMRNYGSDSVIFIYPKQSEGMTEEVCLQRNYPCSDDFKCKTFTLSSQDATIIDAPTDESPLIRFSPNLVYHDLGVETVNLKETIQVKIYSVDGVECRSIRFSPIQWHSNFTIDLTDLPAGIYFVKAFASGQNSSVEKIMKQ